MNLECCSACGSHLIVHGDCVACTPLASVASITVVSRPLTQLVASAVGGSEAASVTPRIIDRDQSL